MQPALKKSDQKTILGFYTLTSGQIHREELPSGAKHPHHPVAIARLARLAVDKNHKRKGLGGLLLFDALNKVLAAAMIIGIYAIIVDAKDKGAKAFYEHYGFQLLQNSELTLFMPMETLLQIKR